MITIKNISNVTYQNQLKKILFNLKVSTIILPTASQDIYQSCLPYFAPYYQNVDYFFPDGRPLQIIASFFYKKKLSRGYGPDIITFLKKLNNRSLSEVYIGNWPQGESEINTLYFPLTKKDYFKQDDLALVKKKLLPKKKYVVWITVGSPKQVVLAYHLKKLVPQGLLIVCVGGGFNLLQNPTPQFIKKTGFEWLYRFLSEPKRLWKRYIFYSPMGLGLFILSCSSFFRKWFTTD